MVLHGWGANAQDVAALASFLNLPRYQFIFPDAPFPHEHSPVGRAWYPFPQEYSLLDHPSFYDQPELAESRNQLTELLQSLEEITGVPLSRTILGGFSQGGAMALDVGLKLPLAALMVLSGYLHAPTRLIEAASRHSTPALVVHGKQDTVVPIAAARQIRESLMGLDVPVQYQELNMGHEIPPAVLQLMQSFIEDRSF